MNTSSLKPLLFSTALVLSAAASADTRIIEVWSCKLLDGKTIEQVSQANKNWLTFMNGKVAGGGIQSYVMTSIVGDNTHFTFADSFPSMAAWTATKAELKTPGGQAADAGINSVAECAGNSLYESTES